MKIEEKRKEIDVIDAAIVNLLDRRAAISKELSLVKARAGLPVIDEERENEVIKHQLGRSSGTIDDGALVRIYRTILDESRRIQTTVRSELSTNEVPK